MKDYSLVVDVESKKYWKTRFVKFEPVPLWECSCQGYGLYCLPWIPRQNIRNSVQNSAAENSKFCANSANPSKFCGNSAREMSVKSSKNRLNFRNPIEVCCPYQFWTKIMQNPGPKNWKLQNVPCKMILKVTSAGFSELWILRTLLDFAEILQSAESRNSRGTACVMRFNWIQNTL